MEGLCYELQLSLMQFRNFSARCSTLLLQKVNLSLTARFFDSSRIYWIPNFWGSKHSRETLENVGTQPKKNWTILTFWALNRKSGSQGNGWTAINSPVHARKKQKESWNIIEGKLVKPVALLLLYSFYLFYQCTQTRFWNFQVHEIVTKVSLELAKNLGNVFEVSP